MTLQKLITNTNRILLLAISMGVALAWAAALRSDATHRVPASDFGENYYGVRSAFHHMDPYDPKAVLQQYKNDGGKNFGGANPQEEVTFRLGVTVLDYPPTTLLVVAPFATLPWQAAYASWLGLISLSMVLAAFLMWNTTSELPVVAGCMACYILFTGFTFLFFGNPLGLAVPFAVIAAWSFLEDRYAPAGVALLALSLALKPQIAAFVWLYFLLAGGKERKRAMQTFAVVGALGIGALIWITSVSPHWLPEFQRNFGVFLGRGGAADPGPSGDTFASWDQIISLQSAVSVFRNDPRFYNPVAYLIGGGLILVWMVSVLRKRTTREGGLLALASISILGLLPIYHRTHDAKLLLLTIPACGILWAGGGARRWVGLGLTAAAILLTSDFPMTFWPALIESLPLRGRLALFAVHPAPLVLFATGSFYLWAYIRCDVPAKRIGAGERTETGAAATVIA